MERWKKSKEDTIDPVVIEKIPQMCLELYTHADNLFELIETSICSCWSAFAGLSSKLGTRIRGKEVVCLRLLGREGEVTEAKRTKEWLVVCQLPDSS